MNYVVGVTGGVMASVGLGAALTSVVLFKMAECCVGGLYGATNSQGPNSMVVTASAIASCGAVLFLVAGTVTALGSSVCLGLAAATIIAKLTTGAIGAVCGLAVTSFGLYLLQNTLCQINRGSIRALN